RIGVPARAGREERRGRAARPRRGALGGAGPLRRGGAGGAGARGRARAARGGRERGGERAALEGAQPAPRARGAAERPAHLRRAGGDRPAARLRARRRWGRAPDERVLPRGEDDLPHARDDHPARDARAQPAQAPRRGPRGRRAHVRRERDPRLPRGAAQRQGAEARDLFVQLVPSTADTALRAGSVRRELHATGLLIAMVPEFSPVVGRVHHDTYHVYTVDVHSVAAADRIATLVRGELAAEFPLACRLAAETARPAMLFFATLLHDVGKAIGGKDHSTRGADMAREILTRLGFPPEDVEEACDLIRNHLVMYHVATRRDIEEPTTVQELARQVHGRAGLC